MTYITLQKLKELKKELKKRKEVLRKEISERIKEAQIKGDISENAEYEEAKETQAFNEGRIIKLENLAKDAKVLSKKPKKDVVQIGSQVIVKNIKGERSEFTIVGSEDSNPMAGQISNESPLGQSFLGLKQEDEVNVQTPKGKIKYKIIKIK